MTGGSWGKGGKEKGASSESGAYRFQDAFLSVRSELCAIIFGVREMGSDFEVAANAGRKEKDTNYQIHKWYTAFGRRQKDMVARPGLLLIPSANAFFRLPCSKPVLDARVDPIVIKGSASPHTHTVMGSNAIGFDTTFDSLRNSECSTCKVKDDKSAYWIPQLFYEHKNGSFEAVPHGGMIVYYLQRSASNETVEAFPDGIRIFTGNPYLRSDPQNQESKAISWLCLDSNGPAVPRTQGFTNTNCPDGLRAQVFFPSCWDGVNLDASDHKSHMAYPDGIDNGRCPPTHPHHLVSIFFEVLFSVRQFNALNDGGRFVLSNGDPTGYGLHGDFMNGWDRSVLSRAVATCTADSGVIEDCLVFQDEDRFYTDDQMNACSATNPIPQEKVNPGNVLSTLPGCVAVTEGPAPATPANLIPGCVPGGGNGSAVPISDMPSSTASSSAPSSASKPAGAASTISPASSSNALAKSATIPVSSSQMYASPSSAPDTSAPPTNQLAASTTQIPASTFTIDLAAAPDILQGASTVPTSAAAKNPTSTWSMSQVSVPSESASDEKSKENNGYNHRGRCRRAMMPGHPRRENTDSLFAHRLRRMQRRHGSHRSN
ncbi:protein of unknown function (DUF1996) domain containing protein [Russula decolorans]